MPRVFPGNRAPAFETRDVFGRSVSVPARPPARAWLQFHRFAA